MPRKRTSRAYGKRDLTTGADDAPKSSPKRRGRTKGTEGPQAKLTSAKEIARRERIAGIMNLRLQGHCLELIGDSQQPPISPQRVHQIITQYLAETATSATEQVRRIELMRLDELQAKVYENAMNGDLHALDRVLAIHDRRRPIDAADRQFSCGDRSFNLAPIVFRISPWPWIKCHGVVVLWFLGLNLLIWAHPSARWQQGSLVERYMFAEFAIWYAALAPALFVMHYRLLHFGIGAWGCNFRLAYPSRNQIRIIVVQSEGSFPLSLVAGIWAREKLSEVLRWKELSLRLDVQGRPRHAPGNYDQDRELDRYSWP
jgi:hypothetical protein